MGLAFLHGLYIVDRRKGESIMQSLIGTHHDLAHGYSAHFTADSNTGGDQMIIRCQHAEDLIVPEASLNRLREIIKANG